MTRIEEFWYCVAPQEDLPLFKGTEIDEEPCANLLQLIDIYRDGLGKEEKKTTNDCYEIHTSDDERLIARIILSHPSSINELRILVGVSDKRLYLDLSYLVHIYRFGENERLVQEDRAHLLKHDTKFFVRMLESSLNKAILANLIANYFINRGLIEILNTFAALSDQQITKIFQNLIAPKEVQQMQAKYRGHGAEQAFARVVRKCGLSFVPEEKDVDPMAGYDPNVNLTNMRIVHRDASNPGCHSFDLVIVDENNQIRVLIQSLIHSSDPGQYGVNKSDETIQIQKLIKSFNDNHQESSQVFLLGSVDGVGFSENPNGTIVKMIDAFDDFFQMNTLFKLPLFFQKIGIISNVKGIVFDSDYFDQKTIQYFNDKYVSPANALVMTANEIDDYNHFVAGKAIVVLDRR